MDPLAAAMRMIFFMATRWLAATDGAFSSSATQPDGSSISGNLVNFHLPEEARSA